MAIESQSHMTRMMKSAVLSICKGLSLKDMFKNYQTHFGQFAGILSWCYLLDTVYDSVS